MKKLFLGLSALIITTILAIYIVLFTQSGNDFVASYIEKTINKDQKDVGFKINDFTLTMNSINFYATIKNDSKISISGDLELFKKRVDLKYDINIKDLSALQNITKQKLNGPFSTSGTFVGDTVLSQIKGISDIAQSKTNYDVQLKDFNPTNINFDIKNAKISKLLYLGNQPEFAEGDLNIKGDIKNTNIPNLDGNIALNITNAKILNKTINKEFNQNIKSNIDFKTTINAQLQANKALIDTNIDSSLLKLKTTKTIVDLVSMKVISDYNLDIDDLSKLKTIINKKLNGSFSTSGDIVTNNGIIKIDGKSDVFQSLTTYDIKMNNSKPEYVKFHITNAKIEKLLSFIDEPVYAHGDLSIDANILNTDVKKLDGTINTRVANAKLINPVINTVFNQKLKDTVTFDLNAQSKLQLDKVITKSTLTSSLANVDISKAVFNVSDLSLNSDYLVNIADLSKLYDITATKMRGKLSIIGDIKKEEKLLLVNGNSKLLGGVLDFTLNNDNFTSKIKDLQIKQVTHMLYYPEVFDSTSALNLNYNLLSKKGKLTGNLLDGHFLPNNFSGLLNQFAKFDITREVYKTVDIDSNINNLVLDSVISMKSKNTQIDVVKSILDLEKSKVDADINAKIRNTNFSFNVKGNTSSPKISFDSKDLLKDQINKDKIKEKLNKAITNKLGEEKAKDLINNFKSLF
ncbi:MAG: hypothetical protein ACERKK_08485 [Poseidonibacter sp.]|uniref:hypothetical protein n=1 Tax=Poseidonibacter sp. TaxID=2321188 RepID=UPI00359EFF8C